MDKSILVLFLLICLSFFVSGQDLEITIDSEAGTTPDSFVWGIDRAIERIGLALTFGDAERERKRLRNAHERLLEVRQMLINGDVDSAERARAEHQKNMRLSKDEIGRLSSEDDSDFNSIDSLETLVDSQEDAIDDLDVEVSTRGNLSDEQRVMLKRFIDSLGSGVGDVRVAIRDKREETLVRIQQRTGRSRVEIVDESERLRENKIVRASVFEDYSVVKIGHKFTTKTVGRDELIDEIMRKFSISDSEIGVLLKIESSEVGEDFESNRLRIKVKVIEKDGNSITSVDIVLRARVNVTSEDLLQNEVVNLASLTKEQVLDALVVREEHDRNETEREIEAESKIRNGMIVTKVKIKWEGFRQELVLRISDRQEVVEYVAKLLNVSTSEVDGVIKFESESEDDDSGNDSNDDSDDSDEDDSSGEDDDNRSGRNRERN